MWPTWHGPTTTCWEARPTSEILQQAAATLDLTEPVAVVVVGLLHVIPDEDDPYGLVARLMEAVPAGSHLVISHLPKDVKPEEMGQMQERSKQMMREPFTMRTHAEVSRFFDGLELVGPGVVQAIEWGQDQAAPGPTGPDGWVTPLYGAVGRKP